MGSHLTPELSPTLMNQCARPPTTSPNELNHMYPCDPAYIFSASLFEWQLLKFYIKKIDVAFFTSKKLDDTFNFSRLKSLEN